MSYQVYKKYISTLVCGAFKVCWASANKGFQDPVQSCYFGPQAMPLIIFPNNHDVPVIYKYNKNNHLWTLDQCKFWTYHFPAGKHRRDFY